MTNNKLDKYQGVIPAFYACYDGEGNICEKRARAFARYLRDAGVRGLYVNGSSGECIYLSVDERKKVLEAVMDEVGKDLTIIAHVACNSTRDSVELARHAESLGVDAIAAIPPIYFKLPPYAIAKYWNDMSAAAPDTDFVIYNIPQLAGVSLTVPLLKEMMRNPKVVGVKNSSMPVQDIQMFKEAGKGRLVVFNGPDEQFISGRLIGADGGIGGTYAVMPKLFLKADDLIKKGENKKAADVQNDICNIIYALCACKGNMYAVIKEVIKRMHGIDCGSVRPPLYPLVPEDEAQIEKCVALIQAAEEKAAEY